MQCTTTSLFLSTRLLSVVRDSSFSKRLVSTGQNTTTVRQHQSRRRPTRPWIYLTCASATAAIVLLSYQNRRERNLLIQQLPLAQQVWDKVLPQRSPTEVAQQVRRMGLMGTKYSVNDELDSIRQWHRAHGYHGGLVVRDLTRPMFGAEDESVTIEEIIQDPTILNRRECYYLYYEVLGNGEIRQEIFCRGTALGFDILTCLQAWMVYDPEIQCRVHRGFLNQANRILEDVLPLLVTDRRATIHVCGHSLGGAVASLLAVKLRRRGYQVVHVTTVGEPRYCASAKDAMQLLRALPSDVLRIEHEQDFVPFVPPFGAHVAAPKLWLTARHGVRYVRPVNSGDTGVGWTDSVWRNFLWEILTKNGRPHRIPHYMDILEQLAAEVP